MIAYIKQYVTTLFLIGILLGPAIFIFSAWIGLNEEAILTLILFATPIWIIYSSYLTNEGIVTEINTVFSNQIKDITLKLNKATDDQKNSEKKEQLWKQTLIEKSFGFPTLLGLIKEYDSICDEKPEQYLRNKKHPAEKSADLVKYEAQRRRTAEFENKKTKSIIEYYESIAPFLLDFKEEIQDLDQAVDQIYAEYSEEEKLDEVTKYLTIQEYKELPTVEKNQMALDRFWERHKSKKLIGRIYERYVGYLYEEQGYDVEYTGIYKGYEDLGRDLICKKGQEIVIIQCKCWSQFKTIYEKHIFQFFGTVFQFRDENPSYKVKALFYTSTELSELARRFAKELGIDLKEKFKMDNTYPCIKCNIAQDGEKIYHLPMDQQYDKVKMTKHHGEYYCKTVKEAEDKGFRRAFRYKGFEKK